MEAATAPLSLTSRLRARTFERECGRLRPLGEAYVARRFSGSLNRADAEDVVSEVLIRLHRKVEAGRGPQNLRAAFFTSVRNAAIDLLRSRAARPTVALEAASGAEATGVAPEEWAEGREDAARLQEALGRMRGNYREAILLRFGLGLTVPEMAKQLGISLPAAKKLVLRATRQVSQRVESIEGAEFCPEMRQMARRSLLEKEACGVAKESESELLHAHFAHCGSCKSFLANLHGTLHDFGTAAVLGLAAGDRLGMRLGPLDHLGNWAASAVDGAHASVDRVRDVAYRAGGLLPGSDPASAGALMGTGQKIAAVCTAGAATTATCLLSGAVGPGIGATAAPERVEPAPAAQVRQVESLSEAPEVVPAPVEASAESEAAAAAEEAKAAREAEKERVEAAPAPAAPAPAPAPAAPAPAPASVPETEPSGEFGVEANAGSSTPAPAPAPTPEASAPSSGAGSEFGGGGSSSSGSAAGSGGGVGFQG